MSETIPLAQIRPWSGNPRKHFPDEDLAELAESIKAVGVLQPVLVRRQQQYVVERCDEGDEVVFYVVDTEGKRPAERYIDEYPDEPSAVKAAAKFMQRDRCSDYELADGERRFRAAKLAGLNEIPAIVRELTDQQMLELALTTREQSRDLTPLERAEGFRRLVEEHHATVEDLAQRIGRSVSTIRGLLRLPHLPAIAREAVDSGHLPVATAMLVARVPGEHSRRKLAIEVLGGDDFYLQDGDGDLDQAERDIKGRIEEDWPALSVRDTKELIQRRYMVELKKAPFSRKTLNLVDGVGSCDDCPKRAGNNAEEFPGVRADVCTDPDCYRAKVAAHQSNLRAKAEASGKTVLVGAEAKGIFAYGGRVSGSGPYVDPEEVFYGGEGKLKSYRKLVGKQLAGDVVLAEDHEGNLHELYPRDKVRASLKELGINDSRNGSSNGGMDSYRRQQAAQRKKAALGKAAAVLALEQVVAQTAENLAGVKGWPLDSSRLWKAAATAIADAAGHEVCRMVARRRGQDGEPREAVRAIIANMVSGPRDWLPLIAELAAAHQAQMWGNAYCSGDDDQRKQFWSAFGLSQSEMVKKAKAQEDEKKAAKTKPATNGKHKAKPIARRITPIPSEAVKQQAYADPWQVKLVDLGLDKETLEKLYDWELDTIDDVYSHASTRGLSIPSSLVVPLEGTSKEESAPLTQGQASRLLKAIVELLGNVGVTACRMCGCTEERCEWCLDDDGNGCEWAEPDLCSRCAETCRKPKKPAKARAT